MMRTRLLLLAILLASSPLSAVAQQTGQGASGPSTSAPPANRVNESRSEKSGDARDDAARSAEATPKELQDEGAPADPPPLVTEQDNGFGWMPYILMLAFMVAGLAGLALMNLKIWGRMNDLETESDKDQYAAEATTNKQQEQIDLLQQKVNLLQEKLNDLTDDRQRPASPPRAASPAPPRPVPADPIAPPSLEPTVRQPVAAPPTVLRLSDGALKSLVDQGRDMTRAEFRDTAAQLGEVADIQIEAGRAILYRGEDDGQLRPLIGIRQDRQTLAVIPSYDYIKDFEHQHYKLRNSEALTLFFDLHQSADAVLRLAAACLVYDDGGELKIEQKGILEGYSA